MRRNFSLAERGEESHTVFFAASRHEEMEQQIREWEKKKSCCYSPVWQPQHLNNSHFDKLQIKSPHHLLHLPLKLIDTLLLFNRHNLPRALWISEKRTESGVFHDSKGVAA